MPVYPGAPSTTFPGSVQSTLANPSSIYTGSLSREGQVRGRDIISRGAVHQFAMERVRLRPLPPMAEDSRQAGEADRIAPRHPYGCLQRRDRIRLGTEEIDVKQSMSALSTS